MLPELRTLELLLRTLELPELLRTLEPLPLLRTVELLPLLRTLELPPCTLEPTLRLAVAVLPLREVPLLRTLPPLLLPLWVRLAEVLREALLRAMLLRALLLRTAPLERAELPGRAARLEERTVDPLRVLAIRAGESPRNPPMP